MQRRRPDSVDELDRDLTLSEASSGGKALAAAWAALAAVDRDPRAARLRAGRLLADARTPPIARAVCARAFAMASTELGDHRTALAVLSTAISELASTNLPSTSPAMLRVERELRMAWSLATFTAERSDEALAELASLLSEPSLGDGERAQLHGQRAIILFQLGRHDDGLADSARALELVCGVPGSESVEARVRSNRAIAATFRGEYGAATRDLERSLEIHRQIGADLRAAQVLHNLGYVATRLGRIDVARRRFDEAATVYQRLGVPAHQLAVDRCEALTAARLVPEARHAAEAAVAELAAVGQGFDMADARLRLAEACLADGDASSAGVAAEAAQSDYERQGRADFAVRAGSLVSRARRHATVDRRELASAAAAEAVALATAGWRTEAMAAFVEAASAALSSGGEGPLAAARICARAVADLSVDEAPPASPGSAGGHGTRLPDGVPARDRAVAPGDATWLALEEHLRALAAESRSDLAASLLHLRRSALAAQQSAADLRSLSGAPGHRVVLAEVARSGTRCALAAGDVAGVLEWSERLRGVEDPVAVGGAAAVSFAEHDGTAYVVDCKHLRIVPLGPMGDIEGSWAAARFAIEYLMRSPGSLPTVPGRAADSAAAMVGLLRRSIATLDDLVGRPVARMLERADSDTPAEAPAHTPAHGRARTPAPIPFVPTGALHDLAWGLLPSVADRPMLLVPNLSGWLRRANLAPAPRSGDVLLVAGPGIESAGDELREVAAAVSRFRPDARIVCLAGADATGEAVLGALASASTLHVAAHGRFRADNSLMSSIELVDGPLTALAMSEVAPAPAGRFVLLSACDTGRVSVHPGDEAIGPVPALLGPGGGEVIAPVAPLVDHVMPKIAARLHRLVLADGAAASALRSLRLATAGPLRVQAAALDADRLVADERWHRAVAAACLVCHGAPSSVPGMASATDRSVAPSRETRAGGRLAPSAGGVSLGESALW